MKIGILHTAFLGDLALAGKLIEGLFRSGHEIFLYSNKQGCLLYQSDSRIKKNVFVNKKKKEKLKSITLIAGQIRDDCLDVLLVPHRSMTSALIAKKSGVPLTIGFFNPWSFLFFKKTISYKKNEHESSRILSLGKQLIDEEIYKNILCDELNYLQSQSLCLDFKKEFSYVFDDEKCYFLCCPGSVWQTKKIPSRLLAALVSKVLQREPSIYCVVSGGPGDRDDIEYFFNELKLQNMVFKDQLGRSRVINAQHCLPIPDLVSLTKQARFVISPDSAPLHIAGGTRTPVVAVFGPTSWSTGFGPLGDRVVLIAHNKLYPHKSLGCQPCSAHGHRRCPLGHHRCMNDLDAEDVFKQMQPILLP